LANVYTGVSEHWHDDYERGRPGWPAGVAAIPGLGSAASVLELGAGTGKLTRVLAATFESVVAVEPDEGMRQLLAELCPEAQVVAGTAEESPVAAGSVDAVFAAEAFHWFDAERAPAEIARVLRPRGALVLMWNLPAGPTEPSIEAVEKLLSTVGPSRGELNYDPMDLNPRRYSSGEWRLALAGSPFDELSEVRLANPQTLDRDALVAFIASMGWIADLPDDERLPLLDEVRSLLTAAEYRRPWETHVHWTRLRGGPESTRT
jgi:SAM-dependent methyltransferase